MTDTAWDAVDRAIVHRLQQNARTTITDVAEAVNVSDNTVRNRIRRLEERGVIRGYRVDVDYNRIGVQHHYQFVCTASVSEREALADEALEVPGVIEVRTLMTGTRNVYVTAAGSDNDDITRIAMALDQLGLGIEEEDLIRSQTHQPLDGFRRQENQ
ncbi:Lrp/AsnC family transcriptional regulator [Halalkalicoccus ordinarius]|uniref:Lrp/AsnC family transcriptional regulator n=1 Tax=Halalkalicoccus ordinarius TaxID=3116651 RepID=UPI00300F5F69